MSNAVNPPKSKPPMLSERLFSVQHTGRDSFWEGRAMTTCAVSGILYVGIAFGALAMFAWFGPGKVSALSPGWRVVAVMLGIVVSSGPPAFFWMEAKAFDWWLNTKIANVQEQSRWRSTYELNAENGKAFWAGVLAVYAAVLLNWG